MQTIALQGILDDFLRQLATPSGLLIVLGDVALTLLVVLLAVVVAKLLRASVSGGILRAGRSPNLATLMGNLVRIGTFVAAGLLILRIFGADWTSLVAVVAVLSLAVSLALQDVLKNFVAGIYLLLERPFSIGDTVAVSGAEGVVESVDVRTTILRGPDGTKVIVPNATVFAQVVTAKAYDTQKIIMRLQNLPVGNEPLPGQVKSVLSRFPEILAQPAPVVRLDEFSTDRANVSVEFWANIERLVPASVMAAMKEQWPEAEITAASADAPAVL